ncbi:MAG: hypothetical protein M1815_003646 [Lichina confinis]|nr:MAG: hypothetical protein M1815_003646 [Lichina confinis]
MGEQAIYDSLCEHYGQVARQEDSQHRRERYAKVAAAFGYAADDLAALPDGANLGVSCGNPLVVAGLKEGETVVDLGSGGGFDVLLAAKKVGPTGRVIGIDMSKDMLRRARANAEKAGLTNVVFVESSITHIAMETPHAPYLSSSSSSSSSSPTFGPVAADCIISNCVVSLVPEDDKQKVFDEMFRLLRPGGRVAISDLLTKRDMPEHMRRDMSLYAACIGGASTVGGYDSYLRRAGFEDSADRKLLGLLFSCEL